MRKLPEQSSSLQRVFANKYFLFLWVVGCLILGIRLIYSGLDTKQAFFAKQQAEAKLKEEERKGLELMEEVNNANSPLEKERRIRDELNMQKPGEIILQLPSPHP